MRANPIRKLRVRTAARGSWRGDSTRPGSAEHVPRSAGSGLRTRPLLCRRCRARGAKHRPYELDSYCHEPRDCSVSTAGFRRPVAAVLDPTKAVLRLATAARLKGVRQVWCCLAVWNGLAYGPLSNWQEHDRPEIRQWLAIDDDARQFGTEFAGSLLSCDRRTGLSNSDSGRQLRQWLTNPLLSPL
jgi:hypothetical protein